MSLKLFKNQGGGKYEILLHGIIGVDVDGAQVAKEIKTLNEIGATEIVERINSIGGSVVQGFSIVSANLMSKAKITTVCEGVCDSIAAVIFSSGDSRRIMEFGSVMIHNVMLGSTKIEDIKDESAKAQAIQMNDSIINILSNKCKGGADRVQALMSKETRFSSDDTISEGFADGKILIGQGETKPAFAENCTREEWMNICKEFSANSGQNINKNSSKMKKVLAFLNLNEDAAEDSVLSAVEAMQNKSSKTLVLQAEIDALKAENGVLRKTKAEAEVDGYIQKGMFDASKKDELVNMCVEDPQAFKALSLIKPEYVNISEGLKTGTKKKTEEKKDLTDKELADKFTNMSKEDPQALEDLERNSPEEFNKLLTAYEKAE